MTKDCGSQQQYEMLCVTNRSYIQVIVCSAAKQRANGVNQANFSTVPWLYQQHWESRNRRDIYGAQFIFIDTQFSVIHERTTELITDSQSSSLFRLDNGDITNRPWSVEIWHLLTVGRVMAHYRFCFFPIQGDLVGCCMSRMDNGDKRIQSNPKRVPRLAGGKYPEKVSSRWGWGSQAKTGQRAPRQVVCYALQGGRWQSSRRQRNNCLNEIWSKSAGHWGNEMLKEDFWNNNSDTSSQKTKNKKRTACSKSFTVRHRG